MPVETEIDKSLEFVDRLKQIDDKINQYNIPRINVSSILEDENLLFIYHREYSTISKQILLIKMLRIQFLKDLQRTPELATNNIRTNLNELIGLMQLFDSKEISKLQHAILMLSKLEINELNKCVEDVKRWPNYRLINRIEFFIERLTLFAIGGRSKYDGEAFLGFNMHFKDIELIKQMYKTTEIKKLWTYKQEMEFFTWARQVIIKAREQPRWEGFLGKEGFYYNLRKGKKYIKMVKDRFGNIEFANLLERIRKEIGESPIEWDRELAELQHRLHDFTYQNVHVIEPARQALLILFQNAINRISSSKVELNELNSILKTLEKNIKKRMKRIKKEVAKLRKKFEKIDNLVADELSKTMPVLIDLMVKFGIMPDKRLADISKILDISEPWLRKYKTDAQILFSKPLIPIGVAFFDATQADKLSLIKLQLINAPLIDQTIETYIDQLEKRIDISLIPKLRRVINFAKEHDNKFVIPLSNTTELLPQVQELLSKLQNKLVAEFKKEGIDLTKPLYG